MNLVDILKLSVGATHLVVGWIEHERGTFALAYKDPKSTDAAVRFMMEAAKNTRAVLGGGPSQPGPYLCQLAPGCPVVWTSDEHEAERA